jgi:hypothetical protein
MLETPQKLCTTRQVISKPMPLPLPKIEKNTFFSIFGKDKDKGKRRFSVKMYKTWGQSAGKSIEPFQYNPQRLDVWGFFAITNTYDFMNLQTQWIVGFVDGEGCFHIGVNKNPTMTCGYQVLPEFTVTQHENNIKVLYALKSYFGCGVVRVNHGDRYCYRVRGFDHLKQIIIPFFEKHKLLTTKRIDFEKFRTVVLMMDKKQHLIPDGLQKISEIQQTMNRKAKNLR